jgi:trigger factor
MTKVQRPPIPPEIKREVRKRCGFGCVICGMPLYEYEHMLEWAEVKRHVASEITLLCRLHHGEKTNGLLPKENVIEANKNPFNLKAGVSKNHLLHYSGKNVQLVLANSVFQFNDLPENSFFAPLVVDGLAIVGFRVEDGKLLLQFIAFDEFNVPVLQIVDSELIYRAEQWDIEWIGQKLTFRQAQRKILLQLVFEPPHTIRMVKGRILFNGIELLIGADFLFCSNNSSFFSGISTTNCPVGLAIGDPVPNAGAGMVFSGIPRYGFDRKAARKFLRKCQNEARLKKPSI